MDDLFGVDFGRGESTVRGEPGAVRGFAKVCTQLLQGTVQVIFLDDRMDYV